MIVELGPCLPFGILMFDVNLFQQTVSLNYAEKYRLNFSVKRTNKLVNVPRIAQMAALHSTSLYVFIRLLKVCLSVRPCVRVLICGHFGKRYPYISAMH